MVQTDETELWHKRLGHVHYRNLFRLSKRELIRGLPKLQKVDKICGECQLGKQIRSSHKKVNSNTTSRPLELLHMDLIGPTRTESRGGKKYILVIVDDFTRFTWVSFLKDKSETLDEVKKIIKRIQNEKGSQVYKIRSDHGSEFENSNFEKFCCDQGISHEFPL
ncbi:DDE-type integrase/transposase/recombinase, partial [Cobetia crustatorum]